MDRKAFIEAKSSGRLRLGATIRITGNVGLHKGTYIVTALCEEGVHVRVGKIPYGGLVKYDEFKLA